MTDLKGANGTKDPESYKHILTIPFLFPGFAYHFSVLLHLVGKILHCFLAFPKAESGLLYPGYFANPQ